VSKPPTEADRSKHDMSQRDRDFWIAVGLWGAALVTSLAMASTLFLSKAFGTPGY